LRSNPGGSLEEAVRFTGLFIKDGPVVQAREATGQVIKDFDPDPGVLYDGPLMVMLNRFSASASEIAAAALQDYGRAIIVGDVSTHGKGTVQQLLQLKNFINSTNDPGTLKITKGKFYRISGASTQKKGVASDIILPDIWNYSTQVGEAALDNALEWDTIQPASYDQLNLVQPYLAELSRHSQERIKTNQDFTYVRQDIEQFMKMQADKSTTLNEHEAIMERERVARQNKARNQERESRPLPAVKIYELTVKNSNEPGLPAPKSFWVTNDVALNSIPKPQFDATEKILKPNSPAANPSLAANLKNVGHVESLLAKPALTKSVPQDPTLEESENIMLDYISMLTKKGILTAYQ
jgi:carboxyl-terminal processing protease